MRRILIVPVALAALVPVAMPASAAPVRHLAVGDWAGFYNSGIGNPNDMGPASMMVTEQTQRRFMGGFSVDHPDLVDDPNIHVDGTIAEAGHLSATGRMGMDHLVIQGMTTELPTAGEIIPCVFEGRWMLTGPEMHADGALGMVHRVGMDDAMAAGRWTGMATHDDGTRSDLTADLATDRMREGMGMLMVGNSFFDIFYDMGFDTDMREGGFTLAAGGEAGSIVVGGTYMPAHAGTPARIEGFHRLHMLGGGVLEGTFFLEQQP